MFYASQGYREIKISLIDLVDFEHIINMISNNVFSVLSLNSQLYSDVSHLDFIIFVFTELSD